MPYGCKLVDKVDKVDMVEFKKDARPNQSFQYKFLNQQMILNLIKISNRLGRATLSHVIIFILLQLIRKINYILYYLYLGKLAVISDR